MARSSRGEDARFSFWKQGFDSPTGYEKALTLGLMLFLYIIISKDFPPFFLVASCHKFR